MTAMRFGILAPMPSELRPVVKAFGLEKGRSGTLDGHVGRAGDADVVATTTGIGTALATAPPSGCWTAATSTTWSWSGSPVPSARPRWSPT